MAVKLLDEWRIVDKWWTEQPIDREYVEVKWEDGRVLVFVKEPAVDPVWRIVRRPLSSGLGPL